MFNSLAVTQNVLFVAVGPEEQGIAQCVFDGKFSFARSVTFEKKPQNRSRYFAYFDFHFFRPKNFGARSAGRRIVCWISLTIIERKLIPSTTSSAPPFSPLNLRHAAPRLSSMTAEIRKRSPSRASGCARSENDMSFFFADFSRSAASWDLICISV